MRWREERKSKRLKSKMGEEEEGERRGEGRSAERGGGGGGESRSRWGGWWWGSDGRIQVQISLSFACGEEREWVISGLHGNVSLL